MAELEILFSQSQRRETEEQLDAMERKLADLVAERKINYKYLGKAVSVLERAKVNQMMAGDPDKLEVIGRVLESGEFDKKAFEIYWDAVERSPSRTPRIEGRLGPLQ